MKRKKAILYDPFLDVLGGGERHILSILEVLSHQGWEISVLWDQDLTPQIESRLHIEMPITFEKNIFRKGYRRDVVEKQDFLKKYDAFFYVTNGSYFFASAKRNFIFCMVPQKNLYKMNIFNKVKTLNYKFISNSQYTQYWLQKWNVTSNVLYPYISSDFFQYHEGLPKEKIILSVGRFFPHLHSKRHDVTIKWFRKMQDMGLLTDYKLVIVGNVKNEDQEYFENIQDLANENKNIELKPNAKYKEILTLYKKASFYWHMAGYEVDETTHPEQVEHLGITPLEAMASGCIVLAYQAGGLRELIKPQQNGFMFTSQEELMNEMKMLLHDEDKQDEIRAHAYEYVKNNFSYTIFEKNVLEVLQLE